MKHKVFTALADQMLYSGGTFIFFVCLANVEGELTLGAYSLCLATAIFFQGIQRNLVSIPLSISDDMSDELVSSLNQTSILSSLIIGLVSSSIIAVFCYVNSLDIVKWASYYLLLSLSLWSYEFKRRLLWRRTDYSNILKLCGGYSLLLIAFGSVLYFLSVEIIYAYPLAFVVAVALIKTNVKVNWSYDRYFVTKQLKHQRYEILSGFAFGGYNNLLIISSGFVFGPSMVALLSVARNLLQPVQVLISAVDSFDKVDSSKKYHSSGKSALLKSLMRSMAIVAVIAAPYMALTVSFSEEINQLLYSGKYSDLVEILLPFSLAYILMIVGHFLENALYITKMAKNLFFNRIICAFLAQAFLVISISYIGVVAMPSSMAVGWLVIVILTLRKITDIERDYQNQ